MNWSEIKVNIPCKDIDEASAIAQMTVPYGIYIEDYSDLLTEAPKIAHIDLIDEELLQKDRTQAIIHIYISPEENPNEAVSFLTDRLNAVNIQNTIDITSIAEADWANGWRKYYHPIKVGTKTVVCPTWEHYEKQEGEVVINLDPGMAFGTGTHDTTRLCITLIEEFLKPNATVLDVGTGSGILSIAALLLGASSATGCDIDKVAVRVAAENAEVNHVGDKFNVYCGDLTKGLSGKFDMICANIVADVIIRFSSDAPRFLNEDGVLLASGIIEERSPEVLDALEQNGFEIIKTYNSKGWVALAAKLKNN